MNSKTRKEEWKMDMQKRLIDTELSVLESGVWGTIGKYSVSAAKALADYSGAKYGLLCHSYFVPSAVQVDCVVTDPAFHVWAAVLL